MMTRSEVKRRMSRFRYRLRRGWWAYCVARRRWWRDRVVAKALRRVQRMLDSAERQARDAESTLAAERDRYQRNLDERDHKIKLLELEIDGLTGINARYNQLVERDLAIFSSQIEEAKSQPNQSAGYGMR